MKILHTVEFYEPVRGGAGEVVRQISERLVRRGHQVTVATTFVKDRHFEECSGVRIEQFRVSGNTVLGITGERHSYESFLRNMDFEIMMNYAAQVWTTDLALPMLREIRSSKVFIPCGYSALRRWSLRLLYAPYFFSLSKYLHNYDAIVYHTELTPDKRFGDRYGIRNWLLIPNGAAREEFADYASGFRRLYGLENCLLILNVSHHNRAKGHDTLFRAFRRLRQENTCLVIIGDEPAGGRSCFSSCQAKALESYGKVRLLTNVPRSLVVSAFFEADVFATTSEVECFPLVIMETMAAGTPWISLPVGNVGELSGGMVVRSLSEMIEAMHFLLNNPGARESLGKEGRRDWEQDYTWDHIVDRYESLYERLTIRRT